MDELINPTTMMAAAALSVAVIFTTTLIRKVVSTFAPWLGKTEVTGTLGKRVEYGSTASRVYNELVLYVLPYLVSALWAIPDLPYLHADINTFGGRLLLSFLVAAFSGLFYKSVKKAIPRFFGVTVEDDESTVGGAG